jgi:hypothetical protein
MHRSRISDELRLVMATLYMDTQHKIMFVIKGTQFVLLYNVEVVRELHITYRRSLV